MGILRLYKKFYHVSNDALNAYALITPTSITAESYISGTGDTNSNILIESGIPIVEEEVGIFYADLNPSLYSSDITYDLVFLVQYTPAAPQNKKLITRFRIKPFNIAQNLDYEISDKNTLDYEIKSTTPIEFEILGTYN